MYQGIEQIVIRLGYDRLVAISYSTSHDMVQAGLDDARTSVIHCGVDDVFSSGVFRPDGSLRSLCGIGSEDFLYVYYGRPGVTKGVDYLISAVPSIVQQIPNSHLALILAKEPRSQYEQLKYTANQTKVAHRIHFIDSFQDRETLIRHLLDANCIVVPSLTEGFGLTAAEACAVGLPLVATKTGSIPEVVSGRHVLVEAQSAVALCDGIVRAWQGQYDPWIEPKRFSWAKMIVAYEDLYKSLNESRIDRHVA